MIIPPTWSLPEANRARLGQTTYGRRRAIVGEGHLLLVLHKPPGADDTGREGVLFWRSPSGEWQWSKGGAGQNALKRHIQGFAELEAKLEQEYESSCDIGQFFDILEALTPLTRAARNMHLALQAAREAIKNDPYLVEMRDLAYEADRNFELLLEDVRNGIQYRTAREAEQQARLSKEAVSASHRLNVMAALFFPLTALASIFGMQFSHGLNERNPLNFWLVFAIGIGLGFAMKNWVVGTSKSQQKENNGAGESKKQPPLLTHG